MKSEEQVTDVRHTGIPMLDQGIRIGRWVFRISKDDHGLRVFLAFCIWIALLAIFQFFSYRFVQIKLFEVPADRLTNPATGFELLESIQLFPFKLILAPLVLWPIFKIYSFLYEKTEALEKRYPKLSWLNVLFRPPLPALVFLGPALVYRLFYEGPWEYLIALSVAVVMYGASVVLLNLLFNFDDATNEDKKEGRLGAACFLVLVSFLCGAISIALLRVASTEGADEKALVTRLCARLSLISIMTDKSKVGWLISRDEKYLTMREKENGVYRTIDVPLSEVKQVIYLDRFGYRDEKVKAFPACSVHG